MGVDFLITETTTLKHIGLTQNHKCIYLTKRSTLISLIMWHQQLQSWALTVLLEKLKC